MKKSKKLVRGWILICALAPLAAAAGGAEAGKEPALDQLEKDQVVEGFRVEAIYLNDTDLPMGARLSHVATGFELDLLRIETAPQGFVWVNTFPDSDRGEPHTQEHLVLGKGNVGRRVAAHELMSLTNSSAFTMQWRTCYHFHTNAGAEAFFPILKTQLGGLLYPDYTDEEIRREVRNFGVSEDTDGTLRLEEKGTVYNEMVSSSDRAFSRLFRRVGHLLYGPNHPLAYDSGGWPAAIREMTPEHIRAFHRRNYHLGNMGMVMALPDRVGLGAALAGTDEVLTALQKQRKEEGTQVTTEADLPQPVPGKPGTVAIAPYPHHNPQQPGVVLLAWPAVRDLSPGEDLLLQLFLSNFASDATSNLYRVFVDSRSREMELGVNSVFSWASSDQGNPVYVGLDDVEAGRIDEETLQKVRDRVERELERIAGWKADDPEFVEFQKQVKSRVIEIRRSMAKFVNTPPGFGFRGTGSGWMRHLHDLKKKDGFRISVTMKPELDAVEELLASGENFWGERLRAWKLLETSPYAVGTKPDPALVEQAQRERQARLDFEVENLKKKYQVDDPQDAIGRYRAEYDAATREHDALESSEPLPPFVESPPMGHDPDLAFEVTRIEGIPNVRSTFEHMTSGTTGLALSMRSTNEEDLPYLAILPELLSEVGVILDGEPLPYEQMVEDLRREVLSLEAYYDASRTTRRLELVVRGSGNDAAESVRAVEWMRRILFHPDWRVENLPRIRDLVDQELGYLRDTTQGSEESWVQDPAEAYRRQHDQLFLATSSFLTRTHSVHRLRWALKDAGEGDSRAAIESFLSHLASAGADASREDLTGLLARLTPEGGGGPEVAESLRSHVVRFDALDEGAKRLAADAASDLERTLSAVPDVALARDWDYLCRQMLADLLQPPAATLARLDEIRKRILVREKARCYVVGSVGTQEKIEEPLAGLVADLAEGKAATPATVDVRLTVAERVQERTERQMPEFVGLTVPQLTGGVVINSAPLTRYRDTDPDSVKRYLASLLYAGHGPHGLFIKTWAAGLAYSNGIRGSAAGGRVLYYAERTPELPQTVRFVVDVLKGIEVDPGLVEYSVAMAFSGSRAARSYEARAAAMAEDLADKQTPEVVSAFRRAVLGVRSEEGLAGELFELLPEVYGMVLPGYGRSCRGVRGGVQFVIGPEKQLALYEEYLKHVEGEEASLARVWPRDYWLVVEPR